MILLTRHWLMQNPRLKRFADAFEMFEEVIDGAIHEHVAGGGDQISVLDDTALADDKFDAHSESGAEWGRRPALTDKGFNALVVIIEFGIRQRGHSGKLKQIGAVSWRALSKATHRDADVRHGLAGCRLVSRCTNIFCDRLMLRLRPVLGKEVCG